jgi:SnoaL-like domain
MDRDIRTRARVAEHRHASERGDSDAEHAIYAADAVLDHPQSGERFRGRGTIQQQRGGHPADRHVTVRRISGNGDLWVSECTITYDGVPSFSVSIMEFTGDHVSHESQYSGDAFAASPWRASLAEPIPADEVGADA